MAVSGNRKRSANVKHHQYGRLITLANGTTAFIPKIELETPISQFGELITTERTPIIELNSSYGVSALREVTELTGSASITSAGGELKLSTGTTATADYVVRQDISKHRNCYSKL